MYEKKKSKKYLSVMYENNKSKIFLSIFDGKAINYYCVTLCSIIFR